MKKAIYILILIAFTSNIKAQFAAVLSKDGFTRLENDSALLAPDENLRGTFQWQKSEDSLSWTEVEANLTGDTLSFKPEITEAYRLQITEGTCLPLYCDTVKVFSKNTTVSEYWSAGVSVSDLLAAGVSVSDLLAAGVSVIDLFNAGIMVGILEQAGVDSLELANAGLIGKLTDFDGNSYKWVRIGDQLWMAENLKTTHYPDGSSIPLVESTSAWVNLGNTDEAYCYYDNSSANGNTYGALYTWETARNACPSGWHLPIDVEWKQLEMYLGMSESETNEFGWRGTNEGSKLAGNASLWNDGHLENNAAFGNSGFMALPGGYRYGTGAFYSLGNYAGFWSATEYSSSTAGRRGLSYDSSDVWRGYADKARGRSVRCIKD